MLSTNLSAFQGMMGDLPKDDKSRAVPSVNQAQPEAVDAPAEPTPCDAGERWVEMPFLHYTTPDIRAKWNLANFDPRNPNDTPNLNLSVMGLILATNIEFTVGRHAWSLVEYSLDRLGFTNIALLVLELHLLVGGVKWQLGEHLNSKL
jgi:hypothetical protein